MKKEEEQELKQRLTDEKLDPEAKRLASTQNRSDIFSQLLEATHKTRTVWSQCLDAIHEAFRNSPYKSRNVTVYSAKNSRRGPTKEEVREAAKLLRHPALGWNVRFSSSRDGSEYRIIYRHRSLIEDQ